MNYVIDGILLLILLLSCILGIRKGFIKTLFGLGAAIFSVIISFKFKETLAKIFSDKWFYDVVYNKIYTYVDGIKETVNATGESVYSALNNGFLKYFNVGNIEILDNESVENISQSVTKPISDILSETVAFVILFFATFIVVTILLKIINAIVKLPVLAQLNGLLGFAAGLLKGLVICFVVSTVFGIIYPYLRLESLANYEEMVNSTVIFKFISTFNPFNVI